MQDLLAAMFFDESGVLARTERLVLRAPADEDAPKYIDAFGNVNPLLAAEYRRNASLMQSYWEEGIKGEASLCCSICMKDGGDFVGYCSVEKLSKRPLEVGINLLPELQAHGFGPEAISAFTESIQRAAGPMDFIAVIEPENVNSQKMFRWLGFKPERIVTLFIKDPDDLRRFEDMRLQGLGEIPEGLLDLAEEFDVQPRKLLSHVLVFRWTEGAQHG